MHCLFFRSLDGSWQCAARCASQLALATWPLFLDWCAHATTLALRLLPQVRRYQFSSFLMRLFFFVLVACSSALPWLPSVLLCLSLFFVLLVVSLLYASFLFLLRRLFLFVCVVCLCAPIWLLASIVYHLSLLFFSFWFCMSIELLCQRSMLFIVFFACSWDFLLCGSVFLYVLRSGCQPTSSASSLWCSSLLSCVCFSSCFAIDICFFLCSFLVAEGLFFMDLCGFLLLTAFGLLVFPIPWCLLILCLFSCVLLIGLSWNCAFSLSCWFLFGCFALLLFPFFLVGGGRNSARAEFFYLPSFLSSEESFSTSMYVCFACCFPFSSCVSLSFLFAFGVPLLLLLRFCCLFFWHAMVVVGPPLFVSFLSALGGLVALYLLFFGSPLFTLLCSQCLFMCSSLVPGLHRLPLLSLLFFAY